MFKSNTIKKRVTKILNAKIERAQKELDEKTNLLENMLDQEIERLEKETEEKKEKLIDELVATIIS